MYSIVDYCVTTGLLSKEALLRRSNLPTFKELRDVDLIKIERVGKSKKYKISNNKRGFISYPISHINLVWTLETPKLFPKVKWVNMGVYKVNTEMSKEDWIPLIPIVDYIKSSFNENEDSDIILLWASDMPCFKFKGSKSCYISLRDILECFSQFIENELHPQFESTRSIK